MRLITSQIIQNQRTHNTRNHRTTLSPEERVRDAQGAWNRILPGRYTTSTQPRRSMDNHRPIVLTTENQRANKPWGDILTEKPDGAT